MTARIPRPRIETTPDPERAAFARDVIDGLSRRQKAIPPRWFYDADGSRLFEEITRLDEYYPTRAEIDILRSHAGDLMAASPSRTELVEFGSGSSVKTELLLAAAGDRIRAYVPIDVSPTALADAALRLKARFPQLQVDPVTADFTALDYLPSRPQTPPRLGFFPGSTIGNFDHRDAIALLKRFRRLLGTGGRLIIGVDLDKDKSVLERAYDDARGVTAQFNLNLLHRINRELGAAIDVSAFRHMARYDPGGRIEMHLVSTGPQSVEILGRRFTFAAGETIHTENSWKFTLARFRFMAQQGGWTASRAFLDADGLFSVHELT